jgi:hypothetical protein
MSPSEIQNLASQIADQMNHQSIRWLELLVTVLIVGFAGYFGAYFGEKGKNRATAEDVAGITKAIKTVEHSFNSLETRMNAQQEMRVACLPERLRVHQQAFVHQRNIMRVMNNKQQINTVSVEMEKWWEENCLYLDKGPRELFIRVVRMMPCHLDDTSPGNAHVLKADWEMVIALRKSIEAAAGLPPIAGEDSDLEPKQA